MDDKEAKQLLDERMERLRYSSYGELCSWIKSGKSENPMVKGASGSGYCIELEVRWDDKPGGAIRVLGSIDDGGLRSIMPICADFIVYPDGQSEKQ